MHPRRAGTPLPHRHPTVASHHPTTRGMSQRPVAPATRPGAPPPSATRPLLACAVPAGNGHPATRSQAQPTPLLPTRTVPLLYCRGTPHIAGHVPPSAGAARDPVQPPGRCVRRPQSGRTPGRRTRPLARGPLAQPLVGHGLVRTDVQRVPGITAARHTGKVSGLETRLPVVSVTCGACSWSRRPYSADGGKQEPGARG